MKVEILDEQAGFSCITKEMADLIPMNFNLVIGRKIKDQFLRSVHNKGKETIFEMTKAQNERLLGGIKKHQDKMKERGASIPIARVISTAPYCGHCNQRFQDLSELNQHTDESRRHQETMRSKAWVYEHIDKEIAECNHRRKQLVAQKLPEGRSAATSSSGSSFSSTSQTQDQPQTYAEASVKQDFEDEEQKERRLVELEAVLAPTFESSISLTKTAKDKRAWCPLIVFDSSKKSSSHETSSSSPSTTSNPNLKPIPLKESASLPSTSPQQPPLETSDQQKKPNLMSSADLLDLLSVLMEWGS